MGLGLTQKSSPWVSDCVREAQLSFVNYGGERVARLQELSRGLDYVPAGRGATALTPVSPVAAAICGPGAASTAVMLLSGMGAPFHLGNRVLWENLPLFGQQTCLCQPKLRWAACCAVWQVHSLL